MQKGYNIKIYNLAGTFQSVITPAALMSGISFTESVNGGQGEMRLKLNLDFDTTTIAYNNIVKVYETDDTHSPRLIYTGVVGNIMRVNENSSEYIEIRCLGLASLLSFFYYYESGYAFTKSLRGDLTMEAIIDYFNTIYPGLISYSSDSLETALSSPSIAFSYTKCLDALKSIAGVFPTWWWSIDNEGVLQFHPISGAVTSTTHKLQVGVNVDRITVEENSEKIVNKYLLKYSGGDPYTATDATSVTANGLRELYEDKSSTINDLATATSQGDAYVTQNKDAKRKITVEVNSKYDIESIRAGHFITIQNLEYSIVSLQVKKMEYNMDRIKLELEDFYSFGNEVFST